MYALDLFNDRDAGVSTQRDLAPTLTAADFETRPTAKHSMPGLLQAPDSKFGSVKFVYALAAEFIGVMLFTFAGTSTPTGNVSTQTATQTPSGASAAANWNVSYVSNPDFYWRCLQGQWHVVGCAE